MLGEASCGRSLLLSCGSSTKVYPDPLFRNDVGIFEVSFLLLLRSAVPAASLSLFFLCQPTAHAQGCVAAHSPQPVISGLDPTNQAAIAHSAGTNFLHGLTISMGYRVY